MKSNNSSERKNSTFFFDLCKEKFNYLITEYDFSLFSKRKDRNLYKIIFLNKTTAVIVHWERNENWIYIELYRLVTGKLTTDPINISAQTEINGYYLDDLLSIRHPGFLPIKSPIDDRDIEDVLTDYSVMLRQHADDVLNGNFAIFGELEKVVKSRIASHKQKDEPN